MRKIRDADQVRQLLKSEISLESVAQGYGVDLRRAGADHLKACCPFHEEKEPSFGISIDKQLYHCFGCKEGGDVFRFVQLMEACTHDQAIHKLAALAGFDLGPYLADPTPEELHQAKLYKYNEFVAETCRHSIGPEFIEWAQRRRFDPQVLDAYGVGYADGLPKGHRAPAKDAKALQLDWVAKWESCVVVPMRDEYGRVCGFRNRFFATDGPRVRGPGDQHPLPIPAIYGLYEARHAIRASGGFLILVEGEGDVWQMAAHGFENTASLVGSKLNDEMLDYLAEHGVTRVVLMPDGDKAGRKFARRFVEQRHKSPVMVKIARLADGDPDEILLRDGPDVIQAAIDDARYTFEYLVDDVVREAEPQTATDKIDVLVEVREYAATAPEYERDLLVQELASRLDLDPSTVRDFFREEVAKDAARLYNIRGERVVLSRMINDEMFIGEVIMAVGRDDFFLDRHRAIFAAIVQLYRTQQHVSTDTIRTFLQNQGAAQAANAVQAIAAEGGDGAEYLLGDIKDKATRRDLQTAANDVIRRIGDTSVDARSVAEVFTRKLSGAIVGQGARLQDSHTVVSDRVRVLHERIQNPHAITGIDLGPDWFTLNHTIRGLQRKQYFALAAPSGVGKTAMASNLVRRVGVELNQPALVLTFETTADVFTDRMVASLSGVEYDKIVTGFLNEDELDLVQSAYEAVGASPLVITERGRSFDEAAAIIRHDVLRRGTVMVVVDYIQLMHVGGNHGMKRHQEVGEISGAFQDLMKELDIALVIVCQINREGAKKGESTKEDVGDSYRIPQDSDVFYILRWKTKEEKSIDGPEGGDLFGTVDKNRHGRSKIGSSIIADLATMRMREARG